MLRDLIYGWRALRHTPGFTTVTVLTLAIGLGATVTMFAAVSAAFFKALPYPGEDRLVKVYQASPTSRDIRVPLPIITDWVAGARSFEALSGYLSGARANVSTGRSARRTSMARVTRPFFAAIGLAPIRGRVFDDSETAVGGPAAVIISYTLWQELFDGRDEVLEERLTLDGLPVPVIGVMPEGFSFPDDTHVWASIDRESGFESRTAHNFQVVGRLRQGSTPASAEDDLTAVTAAIGQVYPDVAREGLGVAVTPLRADLLGPQSSVVLIGLGAVLCVLLVACVNVANLMLARAVSRESETSIRLALGAGRLAIVRSVIAEGLLLALIGAGLGLVVALWGTSFVSAMTPVSVTGGVPLAVDLRVLALTAAATGLAGVLCAALPAFRSAGIDARDALAASGRSIAGTPRRAMNTLVGMEVALTFMLLAGAGLLSRSYAALGAVEPGFRTADLTLAESALGFLPGTTYESADSRRRYFEQFEDAVSAAPRVRGVGLAAILPPGPSPNGQFRVEGRSAPDLGIHYRLVGGDYFEVLNIPIVRGRVFSPADDAGGPEVAVINASLASVVFPGADPIGQRVSMPGMDGGPGVATIVGIVADIRHRGPALPPVPEAYFSYRQRPWRTYAMTLIVDADLPPADVSALLRDRADAVDPLVPIQLTTMASRMDAYLEPARFRASLLGALAVLAFLLSAIGIAGVGSYSVVRRLHEIGIRVALGATPRRVAGLVVRSGMVPVVIGAGVGLAGGLALTRSLAGFLFGVSGRDPLVFTTVLGLLLATGLTATWVPARRAARVNPVDALRG